MELRLQFKDLLYSFSSSFQSGRQMSEALQEGEENLRLIYEIHAPIMHELRIINRSLSVERLSEEEVLNDFANRSSCEDIKNFVDVYFICRATGGDMHKVIMHAIEIIIDKLNIEKDINTITAQKKFEAKIITIIPFIILIFLQLTSPDYVEILYVTVKGRIMMTMAIIATLISYYWSLKITDIEV